MKQIYGFFYKNGDKKWERSSFLYKDFSIKEVIDRNERQQRLLFDGK